MVYSGEFFSDVGAGVGRFAKSLQNPLFFFTLNGTNSAGRRGLLCRVTRFATFIGNAGACEIIDFGRVCTCRVQTGGFQQR